MKKLVLVLGLATLFSCEKEVVKETIVFGCGQFGGGGSGGNW